MTIEAVIDDVRRRWRRVRAGHAVLVCAAALAGLALTLVVADNLIHLPSFLRWLGAAGFLAAAGRLIWSRIRSAVSMRPSDDDIALLVEKSAPALDNRLINAIQLSRQDLPWFGSAVAREVSREASAGLAAVPIREAVPRRQLGRAAMVAGVTLALLVGYAALFPTHFFNAVRRYAMPGAYVPPVTRTHLAVEPGNVTALEGESVSVRAVVTGAVPSKATLTVRDAAGSSIYDMAFAGDAFAFELKDLRGAMTYCVEAGDAESDVFRIEVVEKPRIMRMAIEYRWPDYLRRKPRRDDPADGHISAVKGTRVVIEAVANRPVDRAAVVFDSGRRETVRVEGTKVGLEYEVDRNDRYRLVLTDERGFSDRAAPIYMIACLPDAPPTISIREPAKNLDTPADAEITVSIEARDDLGLTDASLVATDSKGENARPLESWALEGKLDARLGGLVRLQDLGLKPGDTVALVAKAKDLKGQEASSRPIMVRVLSDREEQERVTQDLAALLMRLRKVLEKQRAANAAAQKGAGVASQQKEILDTTLGVIKDWADPRLRRLKAYSQVCGLAGKEMPAAILQTGEPLLATQQAIIRALEEVLNELERTVAAVKAEGPDKALQDAVPVDPSAAAKDLLRGLKEFIEEQKKVVELTQAIKDVNPLDLTDEQKKQLEALKATEEKWGKYFEEKVTDLSKLPPQDFSVAGVLKELIEARSDVELAADALSRKTVEVAVPLEEAGLELAKSLTANIERWLADAPDKIKWEMEEPAEQPEVPMADLPEELEDLIGELLDKEEDMTDETEDVTSSWMDSLNEGAGWTAMDGPISNMSAKGITGNLNPNSNEVGGRSGEGRSGKSSGQMVEESASGKGGRQTPTRATPDPYEKGQVKDTSKDPTGGSTGGGKESGGNKEGLRGQPPPETQRKMDRIADEQADIRNAAEKVKAVLERRSYRSEDLRRAIDIMKQMEDQLRKGHGGDYAAVQKAIVEQLAAAKKVAGDLVDANRDPARGLPRELRDEILNALDEQLPKDYEDAIRAYYKSLSEK